MAGISVQGQRGTFILQRASLEGIIIQGRALKNQPVYRLLDQENDFKGKSREENIIALTMRYFTSRGPALLDDFVWWSGLNMKEAQWGLAQCNPLLIAEKVEGKTYYFAENIHALESSVVHLISGFDEWLLGYKDRNLSLDPKYKSNWCPGNNGMFIPCIIEKGIVKGTWKKRINTSTIQPSIFDNFQVSMDQLTSAIDRYAVFNG